MRFSPLLRGPKVSWNCRCKITLFVFVQFFSIMSFQLYNWRMQNHIVFIFTILSPEWVLECVLKLPVWRDSQFHWLNLYVFSYGSSIYLKLHMQSHIVCICTIFLQNEVSNASSNCLYERMQSCIGYIYAIFPIVSSLMVPQVAWSCRCKVTLFAFVQFFSRIGFQMDKYKVTLFAFLRFSS